LYKYLYIVIKLNWHVIFVSSKDLFTAMIKNQCPHPETHAFKILAFSVPYTQIGEQKKATLLRNAHETIAVSTKNTFCTGLLSYLLWFCKQESQMITCLR
jgi:hypothetical protein